MSADYFCHGRITAASPQIHAAGRAKNCTDKIHFIPIHLMIRLFNLTKSVLLEQSLRFRHQILFRLLLHHTKKKCFVRETIMWKHLNEKILFKSKTLQNTLTTEYTSTNKKQSKTRSFCKVLHKSKKSKFNKTKFSIRTSLN